MQFRVVVPDECQEGETVRIHIADGTEANVTIPRGLVRGDSFVFELPTEQMKNPQALQQQQQSKQNNSKPSKKQQRKQKNASHPIAELDTRSQSENAIKSTTASLMVGTDSAHSSSGGSSSIGYNDTDNHPHNNTSLTISSSQQQHNEDEPRKGFLEKEIIDCQDFMLALAVGLLVGAAIVFGFMLGILHSTEAIYAIHPMEKPKQLLSNSHSQNMNANTNTKQRQQPQAQHQQQQQRRQPTKMYHPGNDNSSPLAAPIEATSS